MFADKVPRRTRPRSEHCLLGTRGRRRGGTRTTTAADHGCRRRVCSWLCFWPTADFCFRLVSLLYSATPAFPIPSQSKPHCELRALATTISACVVFRSRGVVITVASKNENSSPTNVLGIFASFLHFAGKMYSSHSLQRRPWGTDSMRLDATQTGFRNMDSCIVSQPQYSQLVCSSLIKLRLHGSPLDASANHRTTSNC